MFKTQENILLMRPEGQETMKILRKPKKNHDKPWVGHTETCRDCDCVFRLEANDKVKFYSSQRDGDCYEVTCPGCKGKIFVDADLFKVTIR